MRNLLNLKGNDMTKILTILLASLFAVSATAFAADAAPTTGAKAKPAVHKTVKGHKPTTAHKPVHKPGTTANTGTAVK